MSTDVRDLAEDGFHEIQLSGKQLAFLFMATTVVSIVIFLCGVLVGRGVRADGPGGGPGAAGAVAERHDGGDPDGTRSSANQPPPTADVVSPEEFGYPQRLQADVTPVDEILPETPSPEAPTPAPVRPAPVRAAPAKPGAARTASAPASKPAAAPASTDTAPPRAARPAGAWTVQVTALRQRGDAEAMARRLASRGYDAYVDAAAGGVAMYRVRVGSFKDRQEAERMKQRLARDEKFNPFITK
jgi:DedD protein